ncbi:hypothetical protein HPP92_018894 [Vanilla planifolia]|uniref:Uncharacterized protein n=1 Tax=Vanilla planifolia TaxID=51239 RepID=A0A835Q7V1_VANPL|nr:hypothetical protein HPP92_018894 [Vanilla planifolia]
MAYRGLAPLRLPYVVAYRGFLPSVVAYRGLLPSVVAFYRLPWPTFCCGLPWPSSSSSTFRHGLLSSLWEWKIGPTVRELVNPTIGLYNRKSATNIVRAC